MMDLLIRNSSVSQFRKDMQEAVAKRDSMEYAAYKAKRCADALYSKKSERYGKLWAHHFMNIYRIWENV